MIAPLAPAQPPLGAGAHCDASALFVQEISPPLCNGNTVLSQTGDALAAGAEPPRASLLKPNNFYRTSFFKNRFSYDNRMPGI